ncbi:MAG: hypothetical protein WC775_03795 [Patescibacteria group bacterium]|jgi:hypothetical protein
MKAWFVLRALIVAIIILSSLNRSSVFAASGNAVRGLELFPAFSEVVLDKPEQVKEIDITLTNHYPFPISVKVFPIDFKQAGNHGQIDFIGQNSKSYSYSLASFLTFENTLYTIEPRQSQTVRVSAKNRDDLSPGGHYAAVVMQIENGVENTEGTKVTHALSSLILLRKVGGELFNLSLVNISWPHSAVHFSIPKAIELLFQNEGNVHMIPYGRVEIRDMFNRLVSKGVINVASERVFPETQRYIRVLMEKQSFALPISINSIHVRGDDSLQKTKYVYSAPFLYINPWMLSLVLFSAFVFILTVYMLRKKK